MMLRLLSVLVLVASANAFTSPQPWGSRSSMKVNMVEPLKTVEEVSPVNEAVPTKPKSLVKDLNTGEIREVAWVDPAMSANSDISKMAWWAKIAFGFPFLLLFNDFLVSQFHVSFIPSDGPLGFLGRL